MTEQILNVRYKWSKLFAAKNFGGKKCVLEPIEQQELLDDLDQAAQEIAEMMDRGWISVEEKPEPNKRVILFVKRQYEGSSPTVIGHFIPEDNSFVSREFHDEEEVTVIAWQPLPQPPISTPSQNKL